LKKKYFSSHKLAKQQSTNFWSQGILGVNSSTYESNATWSGSLESYNPYLLPQKVSKNPKICCIYNSVPINAKSRFGCLGPLGINDLKKELLF
jgi:hypothetical protein